MGKETVSPFSPEYQPRPCDEKCIQALIDLWQNGSRGDIYYAQIELEMEKNKPDGQRDYWQIHLLTQALERLALATISNREKKG
jgi:hypothetical protein